MMGSTKLGFVVALVVLPGIAMAIGNDTSGCGDIEKAGRLRVSGRGSVSASPNVGKLGVQIEVTSDNATTARNEAAAASNVVFQVLEPLVDAKDVSTTGVSLQPLYKYDSKSGEQSIQGYTFSQTITIKISNATEGSSLGGVIDAVTDAGGNATRIQYLDIELSPESKRAAMNQARTLAVDDAIATAKVLATAADVMLGQVVSMDDSNSPDPIPMPLAVSEVAFSESRVSTPIAMGDQDIHAWVDMEFAICKQQ